MKLQTKYILPFALGLLLFTSVTPQPLPVLSQTQPLIATTTFSLPSNVPSGTNVRITSSDSMTGLSQALKQAFESKFSGTQVNVQPDATDAALKAVLDGKADVAAIGRLLTAEEKNQGLAQVSVRREKIAVLVGADNPFQGNLNNDQFAKIVRGEVTDWSEVGGSAGKIRFVNRPATSDLRSALQSYAVFDNADFSSGTELSADNTEAMIKELGKDGIGYAIASKVVNQPGVRILTMYKTLPTDARYPFSQPFTYVYKGPEPNPAVQAFLGYATAPEGQDVIAQAPIDDGATATTATATGTATTTTTATSPTTSPNATTAGASPSPGSVSTNAVSPGTTGTGTQGTNGTAFSFNPAIGAGDTAAPSSPWSWLWWLLPLGLLGLLLGWLAKYRNRRSGTVADVDTRERGWNANGRDRQTGVRPGTRTEPGIDPGMRTGMRTGSDPGTDPGMRTGMDFGTGAKLGALGALGGTALAASAIASSWRSPAIAAVPVTDVDSRLVLVPHHPEDAYVHWELPESYLQNAQRAGAKLMVRIYDVTGVDPQHDTPVQAWEYDCDEQATRREVMIPQRDRNYVAELGYRAVDGNWARLLRSPVTHVPIEWNPTLDSDSSVPRNEWSG